LMRMRIQVIKWCGSGSTTLNIWNI
jgi:hypothetical protein